MLLHLCACRLHVSAFLLRQLAERRGAEHAGALRGLVASAQVISSFIDKSPWKLFHMHAGEAEDLFLVATRWRLIS